MVTASAMRGTATTNMSMKTRVSGGGARPLEPAATAPRITRKAAKLTIIENRVNRKAVPDLPNNSSQRSTGALSNGSSEPRSRSPAVRSTAMWAPPRNTMNITKGVIML